MDSDKLKSKLECFLDDYNIEANNEPKNRWIKASDYLKAIEMLFKLNVEANREKINSNTRVVIDFNILGTSVDIVQQDNVQSDNFDVEVGDIDKLNSEESDNADND